MTRSSNWTRDELILAMEFYLKCPERCHTDSHPKCKDVARQLNRSPGGLDGIIRNIKWAMTGAAGFGHASQMIIDLAFEYRGMNTDSLKKRKA